MTLYKNKNRKRLTQKSLEWAKKNRQSRLEIQRKWNNSEKGIRSKRKWYESHISELVQKFLSQFSEDEAFLKVAIARGTSNRRFKGVWTRIQVRGVRGCQETALSPQGLEST